MYGLSVNNYNFSVNSVDNYNYQAIMLFLQSLPTSRWSDDDIAELVSEAFQLKCLFPKAVTAVAGTT